MANSLAMDAMYRGLPPDEKQPLPPRTIASNLIEKTPLPTPSRDALTAMTIAGHFSYVASV